MKKRKLQHTLSTLLVATTLLFSACAKKLEDKYPDNYTRDYFSTQSFSEPVEIETENVSTFLLKTEEDANMVFALQEKPKFGVKVIGGRQEIAHLFKDLKIEAPHGGYRTKVHFVLTESTLTAFMEIQDPSLFSESTQQTITEINGVNVIPIFEYSGLTYGNIEKDKNDYEEETRNVVFKPNDKTRSSHVSFSGTVDNRRKVGFDTLPAKEVLRVKMINDRLWNAQKLKEFFLLPEGFENAYAKDRIFLTRIVDDKLYLFKETKLSSLSDLEQELMKKSDERFVLCSKIKKGASEDCLYQAILKHNVTYVKAKLREENNQKYGQIDLEGGVSNQVTGLITYSLNNSLTEIKYDKEYNLENKELFRLDSFKEKVFKGSELKEILGIISKEINVNDNDSYRIQIFDDTLLVQKLTKVEELSIFEKGAFLAGDPRYSQCHETEYIENKLTRDNCVYKPIIKKTVSYGKFKYEKVTGSLQPEITFQSLANDTEATHIRIQKEVASLPFKYIPSEKFPDEIITHKKLDYDLDSEYVYVPMTHGTPRKVEGAAPFYQGTEKIVKIRFEKGGLEVYEPEQMVLNDKGELIRTRMSTNDLNNAPVLKIPGSYVDFTCARDERDQCTGTTTVETEKSWKDQSYFLPSLENLQVQEINSLDLFTVEDNPCVYKIAQKLTHYEIKPGVINIELEKTYRTSSDFRCIIDHYIADPEGLSELSSAAFKVRYHYSLMRLKDLESPNYEKVPYPVTEHGEFGFFKNFVKLENDSHDVMRQQKQYYLNRWNPKKKEVTYYLNDNFYKPENASYLKMTELGINHINNVLKDAETGIQLNLKNGTDVKVGDLKYSSIVLIDDPLSNGLLGYAPTVANPRTGEILQGHVNMYPGNIRSMSRSVYESMVDLSYDESTEDQSLSSLVKEKLSPERLGEIKKAINLGKLLPTSKSVNLDIIRAMPRDTLKQRAVAYNKTKYNKELVYERPKSNEFEAWVKYDQDKTDYFSHHCAYSMEFLPGSKSIKKIFKEVRDNKALWVTVNKKSRLRRWKELSNAERKWVADNLAPRIYLSTFIHEMGHNLGLRHNFIGSFDKDNYYTDEEAQKLGLDRSPEYSSVMDYSGEELNSLTVFGKYDVAALRYGYARKIEIETEKGIATVPLKGTIKNTLQTNNNARAKNYLFCTDENAGLSPLCNRFDEGASFQEIADWRIKNYMTEYRYRNFRDDREEFKKYSMNYYAAARFNEFTQIQNLFHYMADFRPIDYLNFECTEEQRQQYPAPCKVFDEDKVLFRTVGNFFNNILKTPDHICVVNFTKNNRTQKAYLPFQDLFENIPKSDGENITSCFDPRVKEAITNLVEDRFQANQNIRLISEGGKALNSIREQNEKFKYSDDIGIRGSWVDRALAARFIFKRTTDMPFKMKTIALIDYEKVADTTFNVLEHLVLREPLKDPIPFKNANGDLVTELYQIDAKSLIDTEDLSPYIKRALMLPEEGDEYLLPIIIKNAHRGNQALDVTNKDLITAYSRLFEVKKGILETLGNSDKGASLVDIDGTNYIANKNNFFAQTMMSSIGLESELATIDEESLIKIAQARQNPIANIPDGLPIELSEVEKTLLSQGEMEIMTIKNLKKQGLDTKEKLAKIYGIKVAESIGPKVEIDDQKLEILDQLARALNAQLIDPEGKDEKVKLVMSVDLKTVIEFANKSLTNKNNFYRYVIQNLPSESRR